MIGIDNGFRSQEVIFGVFCAVQMVTIFVVRVWNTKGSLAERFVVNKEFAWKWAIGAGIVLVVNLVYLLQ